MLDDIVAKYLQIFPNDRIGMDLLMQQIKNGDAMNTRKNFTGHIAGDAIIFSPDLKKVLMIYHKLSDRWQQPGGHWDPDEPGPWLTAEREAYEETGVTIDRRINLFKDDARVPLQIYTGHVIPNPKKGEPQHWHHDFRYGFIAKSEDLGQIDDDGVKDSKWFPVDHNFHADLSEAIARLQKLIV